MLDDLNFIENRMNELSTIAQRLNKKSREFVEEQPVLSIVCAFIVGVTTGIILYSVEVENDEKKPLLQ